MTPCISGVNGEDVALHGDFGPTRGRRVWRTAPPVVPKQTLWNPPWHGNLAQGSRRCLALNPALACAIARDKVMSDGPGGGGIASVLTRGRPIQDIWFNRKNIIILYKYIYIYIYVYIYNTNVRARVTKTTRIFLGVLMAPNSQNVELSPKTPVESINPPQKLHGVFVTRVNTCVLYEPDYIYIYIYIYFCISLQGTRTARFKTGILNHRHGSKREMARFKTV